jgi:predicted GNAT superfamily acetyltransferase
MDSAKPTAARDLPVYDDRASSIEVRRLSTFEENRQCEALQAVVWGTGDVVRVPTLVMITAQINGGFAFGAFDEGRIVGFVLTSPGLTETGKIKQCSILMAVDPAYQGHGIGYRLKLAQREAVLAQGLDLLTWTFDPLASPNAHLNLAKLGCVASRYMENVYGIAETGLNAGLPSDRLFVEWWIREPAVVARLTGSRPEPPRDLPAINRVTFTPQSLPVFADWDPGRTEPVLLAEIPHSIKALKLADMQLAQRWRSGLRELLQGYFARGYRATGFHSVPTAGGKRCYLRLETGY